MPTPTPTRRFPPPWRVERTDPESFHVVDANGLTVARVPCRDDLQKWSFGGGYLTSDEARRIAAGIARLPELLMERRGFHPRGKGPYRMSRDRPFHVALPEAYVRENWFDIDAICKLNGIPFRPTGEHITDGGMWTVYDFTWQIDAMLFWNHFRGRWLRGTEFHYPERPDSLPALKLPTEARFNKPRPER